MRQFVMFVIEVSNSFVNIVPKNKTTTNHEKENEGV